MIAHFSGQCQPPAALEYPPLGNAAEHLESLAQFAPTGANHESRRLAARRAAAGMARRRFDLKVELSLIGLSLAFIHLDLRHPPPHHSNLRFSASPASRMLAYARHEYAPAGLHEPIPNFHMTGLVVKMWQGRPRPCCKAEAALPHLMFLVVPFPNFRF